MTIKYNIQGLLIYATVVLHLAALLVWLFRRRAGLVVYAIAFVLALASVIYRTVHVGHAPLQSLFEVFLCLAALMFPLSMLSRRMLKIGAEGADMFLAAAILIPAGFVFSDQPQQLPPALQSLLFIPHVAAYMTAYAIMVKAAVLAATLLAGRAGEKDASVPALDVSVDRLVRMGFPLLTLGLLLGAVWGKQAWGDWWNWDPKELWSLATWLVYVFYFHLRYVYGRKWLRTQAAVVLLAAALIVITLIWVNLARTFQGLHSYA